jgi:glutathione synthase/RimK-type ligase-like ATP-grasp enzyme
MLNILEKADGFLWHWANWIPSDFLVAIPLLRAASEMGVEVFPDLETCLHYDDKIAQTYLLNAIGAPIAETDIFYKKRDALRWTQNASWPQVFKLRRGSGSLTVKLVRTPGEARRMIRKMFGAGILPVETPFQDIGTRVSIAKKKGTVVDLLKKAPRGVMKLTRRRHSMPRERDYAMFQRFLPGNEFDTRIITVGSRAMGVRRYNRPGDFRASGGGNSAYDPSLIDLRLVSISQEISRRLRFQEMTYDFLFDELGEPKIVEIGFATPTIFYRPCPGWWDEEMNWHDAEGPMFVEDFILEDMLADIQRKNG